MPRCPSCETMVGLETSDPEVDDLNYSGSTITGSVRIVRICVECGEELKETTLEIHEEVENFCDSDEDGHDVEVEENLSILEEGGGRYKKSYYGAEGTLHLKCSCGKTFDVEWSDKVAASSMDDLV